MGRRNPEKFLTEEFAIGDAAERWQGDAFDLKGMNDQRTKEEVQRKIDLIEKRARDEKIEKENVAFFWRAIAMLGVVMAALPVKVYWEEIFWR